MTSATHLEETLVSLSQAVILFGFVVDFLQPALCSAVVVVPSLNLLRALSSIGKSCENVVAFLVPSFTCVDGVPRKLCVCEGRFLPGKPWKERGSSQALGSHGSLNTI